ncbi:MAG TPA: protein-export chaperone SecB [Xanthomonadales bacterium]|nr:protein-export chaperone SecB [Xanthomonadales bacterium]
MAETNNGAAQGAATAQLSVQKIYVKDASFEVPSAPAIFQEQGQPQIQLNLSQKVNNFADNVYEVVLTVTVTCKLGERTAYLAEVQQAGVFGLVGFPQSDLQTVLATYCPHTLFPYARQAVADLILGGGFPPFVLQPINFEQLYSEQQQRRASAQPAASA